MQAKNLLRSQSSRFQGITAILVTALALLLLAATVLVGYLLPFGLYEAYKVSPVEMLNGYVGIYLAASFLAKAGLQPIPSALIVHYRLLPIPTGLLISLAMMQSIFHFLFFLECIFLFTFSLACNKQFDFSIAWASMLFLAVITIGLYAVICKIAILQWTHRYPYQRRINFTALLSVLLLSGLAVKQNYPAELLDKFLASNTLAIGGSISAFLLLGWWWQRLMAGLWRYA